MCARGSCTDASSVRTSPVDSTTGKTCRFAGQVEEERAQLAFGERVQCVGRSREMCRQSDDSTAIRLLGFERESTQPHVVAHPVGERLQFL